MASLKTVQMLLQQLWTVKSAPKLRRLAAFQPWSWTPDLRTQYFLVFMTVTEQMFQFGASGYNILEKYTTRDETSHGSESTMMWIYPKHLSSSSFWVILGGRQIYFLPIPFIQNCPTFGTKYEILPAEGWGFMRVICHCCCCYLILS